MPTDPRLPARLRALREQRGLSVRALARLITYSHAYIVQVETGRRPPPPDLVRRVDDVFGADGELIALLSPASDLNPEARDRVGTVERAPCRADQTSLAALGAILASQRRLEDTVGAAAMWPVVHAQHQLALAVLRRVPYQLRPAAGTLAAQYCQYAGWLALATGRRGALRLLEDAQALAAEAGDREVQATARSFRGYASHLRGRPAEVVAMSHAALLPGIHPRQATSSTLQVALGHAMLGEIRPALRMLAAGTDLAGVAAEHTGPVPDWQYYYTPPFFTLERGRVLATLAAASGRRRYAQDAAGLLRAGVDGMPAEHRGTEWLADPFLTTLGRVQRLLGDHAGLAETVAEMRQIAQVTGAADLARQADALARVVAG